MTEQTSLPGVPQKFYTSTSSYHYYYSYFIFFINRFNVLTINCLKKEIFILLQRK